MYLINKGIKYLVLSLLAICFFGYIVLKIDLVNYFSYSEWVYLFESYKTGALLAI